MQKADKSGQTRVSPNFARARAERGLTQSVATEADAIAFAAGETAFSAREIVGGGDFAPLHATLLVKLWPRLAMWSWSDARNGACRA